MVLPPSLEKIHSCTLAQHVQAKSDRIISCVYYHYRKTDLAMQGFLCPQMQHQVHVFEIVYACKRRSHVKTRTGIGIEIIHIREQARLELSRCQNVCMSAKPSEKPTQS